MPPPVFRATSNSSLNQKASRRIRLNPRKSIALAKDGSVYDMQAIAENKYGLSGGRIPSALYPALFDMFCSHLRNTDMQPPSEYTYDAECKTILIKLSIIGLSQFDSSFLRGNTEFTRLFREAWPGILIWLHRIEQPEIWHLQPTEAPSAPLLIQSLFMATEYYGVLQELLITKEFLTFATHMLIRDDWEREDVFAASVWFMNMLNLHKRLQEATDAVEQVMIQARPRSSQAFTVLVNRLRFVSNTHNARCVRVMVKILGHPIMDSLEIKSRFIRAHSMTELIRALQRIDIHPFSSFSPPELTPSTLVRDCFDAIIKTLKTPRKTSSLVKESLDQGLLEVMLRFLQGKNKDLYAVDSQGNNRPLSLIERVYPSLCTIPSIARCASRAVRSAVGSTGTTVSTLEDSRFKAAWVEFYFLLTERMLFWTLHAQRRKRLRCDNPNCSTVGDKRNFQTCASCNEAIYCSRLCQKTAWKSHSHRKLCRTNKFRNNQGSILRRKSDRSFVKELAIVEVSRHAKSMYKQAVKDDPESLNTIFGFRVDFVQFPPDLSFIYHPDEYVSDDASDDTTNESEAKYRSACRRIVMNGEHRGGVFIEIRVPIGGDKYETLMCMGDVGQPAYDGNAPSSRSGKVAEVLQRGKAAGGRPRRVCTGSRRPLEDPLEAEYDEVDELLRRLKIAIVRVPQRLDGDINASVVEQYLNDIHDSTLGRYS